MKRAQVYGYVLALALIVCSFTALADEIAYSDIDHAILELHIDSSFELKEKGSKPSVSQAKVNLELYPANDYRQKILSLATDGQAD